jgi:fatty-acyl-CoA synthase
LAETLVDYLESSGRARDGGIRLLDRQEQERWVGWAEVRERALAVCGGLRALGIERGERVALVFPTGVGFFAAFFGALIAGAVAVPLYPPVRLGRLGQYLERTARMIAAAGAAVVLADPRVKRLLGEAVAAARPRLGCRTLEELPRERGEAVRPVAGELALIQFSSGTTVEPKPVALTHAALVAQIEVLSGFFHDGAGARHSCVSWLPLYHDMGLIGCVLTPLARDATVTLLGPELFVARPALWLRALSRYRATISAAPNFGYALCLSRIADEDLAGVDLAAWEVALNGAETVVPPVLRAFAERFGRWGFHPSALTPVYGLSEAALAVTFSPLGQPFRSRCFDREALAARGEALPLAGGREIASVGRPLPGVRLALRDDRGRELPEGKIGRIWVQSPSLMAGYFGDPAATARVLRDGWLDSGDLGFLAAGELYLTGRAKDLLLLRGRNHAPEEVERAIAGVAGVRAGCVVAASWLPEGATGELLGLFVEHAREALPGEVANLPAACREAVLVATGLGVDELLVLAPGTLPRTSSGKLRRAETLRLHLAAALEAPDAVTPLRMAGAIARSGLAYARLRWRRAGQRPADPVSPRREDLS